MENMKMSTTKGTKLLFTASAILLGVRVFFPGVLDALGNSRLITIAAIAIAVLTGAAWYNNQGFVEFIASRLFSWKKENEEPRKDTVAPERRQVVPSVEDVEDEDIMSYDLDIPDIESEPKTGEGNIKIPFSPETLRSMNAAGVTMKLVAGEWTVVPL